MSPSPLSNESTTPSSPETESRDQPSSNSHAHPLRNSLRSLKGPTQFVGFWTAVALPFVHVSLIASGLEGTVALVFLALLALNFVALYVGHGYNQ
ncbi:hypothetical protein OB955_06475 [Halobacteria archaeon AArc-m2/3/4]|uniref:Uncharacterized protein n=1 Tax=Natronoglomus mannanivorans TaxID=2979990 RepID=A0AAP2YX94_9EURY|nr:hypothetical protein [Halobacteria archaeon AArc-xg1-1]MCU4972381.1 hypothetical protein [Halobacteria archaeon AArc-m2/3/4]